jgi:4-amino-4-deoxy-L-arabinose transferase-like glycosyltransferase
MRPFSTVRIQVLIALGALLLFVPGLGAVHLFDWDEINFAEIAREMLVSGDWSRPQIEFQPFHEKPPLYMWMQAISMSVFGVGEFAARLPNAICGAITLLLLFRIGVRERGNAFGLLWVLAYVGSILPNLYFRSGIIDPWFNLFIFLGLYTFIRSVRDSSWRWSVIGGALIGLAVMTKGPAAVVILGITGVVYWANRRFQLFFRLAHLALLLLSLLLVVSLWFGLDYLRNGPAFSIAFFERQVALFTDEDAGHGGFFGYHFVVLLFGCFPSSLFAVQEMLKPTRGADVQNDLRRWMLILFWVVLILFSIVNTKIVHYSSLCYFPLTYLAALQLERIWQKREPFGWTRFGLGIMGSAIACVFIAVPYFGMHPELIKPLLANDPFAQANLDAPVHWSGVEALVGVWLFGILLAAHFLHASGRVRAALISSFGGTAVFISLALALFISRIEGYSQRAAVDFFASHAGERCWLMTKDYKSYVPPFHGRTTEARPDEPVLLTGPIDRPVHLACKVTDAEDVRAIGTFVETGRANGFVFFRRDP